jgi:glyoxylase I family protein
MSFGQAAGLIRADCLAPRIPSPDELDGIRQRAKEVRTMPIEHVLAVVPVSDLERADAWYEALFGRPADNRPMPSLVEWQVTGAGWVEVTVDTDRAGSGLLNFAVDDLAATRDQLATRGVATADLRGRVLSSKRLLQVTTLLTSDM